MAPSAPKSPAYTAVVSGASGFIGTEVVKQLLEKGYNVRGTVRSTANQEKIKHLSQLGEVSSYRLHAARQVSVLIPKYCC